MTDVEEAIAVLEDEVFNLVADTRTKPGTVNWFLLQARGLGLSMLRGMVKTGYHTSPTAAERYRRSIKVKGLTKEELDRALP